ncbi:FecR domain-containing protein [Bradyrhizobium guangdongense]|uniref:FecR domain-containing protein n=1 Tax=Bradyrhizobium guangdongense TaxID=1325090 RepID=UPI001FCF9933|nr:FecR domain-containing protein [Bradyrhizobium guangdongense]
MDGQGSLSPASSHVDSFTAKAHGHVPDGAVVIADPNLIFHGEFKRTGLDLVLSHDGHDVVVHDYFRGDKRAAIASPDGAHLTGDIVSALTGYVQVAQAAPGAAAAQVIGHVTKLTGSATAIRNGVSVVLNNGDNVEKGDVVSTGSESTLGITFVDGTVFGLSSNARMVLNEMVYDPNGSNNSSLLSLVAGTITFVAGETAKHGDMKIDTPVATMGIRGTAVLTEINFVVPAGGGDPQPQANFQVLVEPNGTTGSYILFDKLTLLPIATVNQAGQMIQISGGNVSVTNALLSPDVQKLITDVFTLKFTDNNTNTKLTTNFTDTITQNGNIVFIKTDTGATATATFNNAVNTGGGSGQGGADKAAERFPGPPQARSLDANGNVTSSFKLTEHTKATADHSDATGDTIGPDTVSGRITFVDQNLGDRPTVAVDLAAAPNYVYKDAGQHDVTGSLTALQKQDIAATQIQLSVVPDGGNTNNGSAVWTYTIPDHVFDFLAAGETLTLTYMVRVDDNFAVQPETTFIPITITITGTNDKPVITSSAPVITFSGGTSVPGGPLTSDVPTSGTLDFTDVDLTDKHTISVALTSATLPDHGTVPPGPLAAFQSALSVAIAADSTGDGTGTINWSLADLPVYLADFIPKGEVLTLVYTVTLTDSQGATAQQTITVEITGTDAPAVVWIATAKPDVPPGGFWENPTNWATGTVPTIDDDVIVITDQLHGLTPSFPATIDAAAFARSVTMNDFGGPPPELLNLSSLTISGSLDMSADSILTNTATGTISVGGLAEILDTSVLTNAGTLKLAVGGDFAVDAVITNSGTLELLGGTLKTLAEIHNTGGMLKADAGATLIVDGATVDGGTVTILGTLELDGTSLIENGTLNNSGMVDVKGAVELLHETVVNSSLGTVKVEGSHTLTLSSTEISGGAVNGTGTIDVARASKIDGGATLSTSVVSADAKLTLDGVTVSGSVITDNSSIELDNTVQLKGGARIQGGPVLNTGTLEITGAATLFNDVVTNTGTVKVDGGQTLTLSGTEITGGIVNGTGTIDVIGASKIDGGATLSTSAVIADAKLTLDGVTVSGSVITVQSGVELDDTVQLKGGARIQGGPVTNKDTLEIAGAATLLNDIVTNNGTVTVDGSQTLTLSGTEISGGTINGSGTIDITGASRINGGATLSTSEIIADAALTLDGITVSGSVITDHSGITLDNTVQLKGDATIQGGAVTNTGALQVAGAATLLNDVVTNNGAVTVNDSQTLTLSGTEISGGTIDGSGTIDVTGTSKIDGGATLSTRAVIASAELTLDGATVSGTVITDNGGIAFDNTVKLKDGARVQGGAVTNTGTLEIAGAATLLNDVVTNTGTVTVDGGQTLTLSGTEISGGSVNGSGTIDVTGAGKIDGNASLSTGAVTVESGVTLTLGDAAVTGTAIANHGIVKVDASRTLTLSDANLTGGKLTVLGTLDSSGATTIADACITNNGLTEAVGGLLTLVATTSATIANAGTLRANGAELDIDHEAVTNTSTLAAINGGTLKLISTTVTNTAGAVSVASGSTLGLVGATIDGGTLMIAGMLVSTDTSAINDASITNTGTITVTGGTLTIDPATLHAIVNHNLIQASGGELDISGEDISNTANLKAVNHGTLKLANLTISNSVTGAVTVDSQSELYLSGASINGGSLSNAGNLYGVTGLNTVTGGVSNTGAIEVQSGTLNLSGGLTGVGALIVDDGATLELGGATAQTVTFAGGVDTLQLDKVSGQNFTGTITVLASQAGTFIVTGDAGITTSSGDALDVTSTGGASGQPAAIILTLTGNLTGAANGVAVTQNGVGNVSLKATGDIKGTTGHGIWLSFGADGGGGITVNDLSGMATGTGANSAGVLAENLNAANAGDILITQLGGAAGGAFGIDATTWGNGNVTIDAGGNIAGSSVYGVRARSYGSGDVVVTTEAGSVVTSGSSGIVAVNRATSIGASEDSRIIVNAYGTINSGSSLNLSGNTPAGIQAGYTGATNGSSVNADVNGSVVVNNHASITAAAGYGIHAYNYGNGDVTVNDAAGTTIVGAEEGIRAQALSGGTGDVTVTLGAGASVKGATSYGILAYTIDQGDIDVILAAGDIVASGSSGIVAVNYAAAIADGAGSTISVKAHGIIHSGSALNNDGATPGAIIAGYKPGGNATFSNAVNGDVTVISDATITADAGYGIDAFTWGIGKITVTTGASSSITSAGIAIGAFDHGGGDVSVTNEGAATGSVALGVVAVGQDSVTILNDGTLTATGTAGVVVTQNDTGETGNPVATGSTHIINNGSVVGASGHYAIFVQENMTGTALIDNAGTIGPADAGSVTSTTYAIAESGGAVTINNTGHINGNISVATATFNNEAGGIWTVSGTSVFGTLSSIVNAGEIDLLNGASAVVNGPGITNGGEIGSWGTASITGTITNNHLIEVHTGTLTLFGSLSGSGSVTIDAGASLDIKDVVSQTVTFGGAGAELEIDTATFGGAIAGFAANEKIDLSTIVWDSGTTAVYDDETGKLVVSDTHSDSISLTLIGDYSDVHFLTSSDGAGGTIVELAPVDHWINTAGGSWNTASNWSVGVPSASYDVKLDAAGTYMIDSTTSVTIHDLTVISGVTLLTEPGTVFTVSGDLLDNGLIEAGPFSNNNISTVDIKGNVSGTGAIEISNKAVVEIEGAASGIIVYYDNGLGTLVLDDSKDFRGFISGSPAGAPLSSGNEIDMKDLAWTATMSAQAHYNSDTKITTVDFYNGATTITLSFLGKDINWNLQSDGHGGTTVSDPLADTSMTIGSGTVLDLNEASAQDVTFTNESGTTGTLVIEHAADYTGVINGFAGDGTVTNSDLLDLKDIDFSHLTGVTYTQNADQLGGTLTLSDRTDTAIIKFSGSYTVDSFNFVSDGAGGTLVVDPPTGPILVGTVGQDQFTFANSTLPVQSTIVNFDSGQDKIDLQQFANIHSFSDIAVTQQGSDTLVTLDDHQSILLKNLVASSMHASDFILANHA